MGTIEKAGAGRAGSVKKRKIGEGPPLFFFFFLNRSRQEPITLIPFVPRPLFRSSLPTESLEQAGLKIKRPTKRVIKTTYKCTLVVWMKITPKSVKMAKVWPNIGPEYFCVLLTLWTKMRRWMFIRLFLDGDHLWSWARHIQVYRKRRTGHVTRVKSHVTRFLQFFT